MPDPTKYVPDFNYSGWEGDSPTEPKPGAELDIDFAKIQHSIGETIDALKDVRRSDGQVRNGTVGFDALQSGVKAAIVGKEYDYDALAGLDDARTYRTAETVMQSNIPASAQSIRTNGYYSPGDGGGALYAEGDEGPGAIQSGDGRWWVPVPGDVVNAKWFGVKGDGVTDDANASRKAILFTNYYSTSKVLYFPPGDYILGSRVGIEAVGPEEYIDLEIRGDSCDTVNFIVDGAVNPDGAFVFTKDGPRFRLKMCDITIWARSESGNCGTAIEAACINTGAGIAHILEIDNVRVSTEDFLVNRIGGVNDVANPSYFSTGLDIVRCNRVRINRFYCRMPKQDTNDDAIRYADDSVNYLCKYGIKLTDSYGPLIEAPAIHQAETGIYITSKELPVEGLTIKDIEAVNVKEGVSVVREAGSPAGTEPGGHISGRHINYRDVGIRLHFRKFIIIGDIVFYNQNTLAGTIGQENPVDILIIGNNVTVHNNTFTYDAGVDRIGVFQQGLGTAGETDPGLVVEANNFFSTFLYAVRSAPAKPPSVGTNRFGPGVQHEVFLPSVGEVASKKAPFSPLLMSDLHTPVVSNINREATSITPVRAFFTKDGSVLRMQGRLSIVPDMAGEKLAFDLSLPDMFSYALNNDHLSGVISSYAGAEPVTGVIYGNGTTARVEVKSHGTANGFYYYDLSLRL